MLRKMDFAKKAFKLSSEIKFPLLDQDIINVILGNSIENIPQKYNFQLFKKKYKIINNVKILHFNGDNPDKYILHSNNRRIISMWEDYIK